MSIDSVWQTKNDNNDMAVLFQQFYLHVWFDAKMKLYEYNEETGIDRINRKLEAAFLLMGTFVSIRECMTYYCSRIYDIYSFKMAGVVNTRLAF